MITPSQLGIAIDARELWIEVSESPDGNAFGKGLVATATEEAGWLYLAGRPILNESSYPWRPEYCFARIVTRYDVIGDPVPLEDVNVPAGRALIVVVGLKVVADSGKAHVVDPPTCRWAQTPGPCEHGCPIPLQYPCTREREA